MARELAQQAGAPTILIDDVDANPDFNELAEQCARIDKTGQPEVWIALGGGSVIDSAKVFAASAGNFSNVRTYLETGKGGGEGIIANADHCCPDNRRHGL